MKSRFLILAVFCALVLGLPKMAFAQKSGGQSELSTGQRLDVMSSKLDLLRRSLSSAIRVMTDKSKDTSKDTKANADDPIVRLKYTKRTYRRKLRMLMTSPPKTTRPRSLIAPQSTGSRPRSRS